MFEAGLYNGRRVVVTGGGTGLGRSTARRLAGLGADLVLVGRREHILKEAADDIGRECGVAVQCVACDIRDNAAVEAAFERIFAAGVPAALINNAAANFIARTETLSPRAIEAVLSTTLNGTFWCTLAAGKRWLAGGHRGTVLSIVSPNAETGSPYVVPSAMGKAGVLAMTKSLAVEWGRRGIRCVAISPGPFPTPGAWARLFPRKDLAEQAETMSPMGRPGRHDELADLVAYLLSDQAGYINGVTVTIDGGRTTKGSALFSFLEALTDEEWEAMRPPAKPAKPKE